MAAVEVTGVLHFTDGSKLVLKWPRQAGNEATTILANIRKALESDRILAEVDGSLLIIPIQHLKYVQITPAPEKLPGGVLMGVKVSS